MSKKYEFGFNLSSLATYTDEVGGELMRKAILEGETAKIIKVQPGIKGSQSINLLDSNLIVQDGSCGWNSSGSTIYTQRDITVCAYKVNEALCPADLNDYWLGQLLTPGSYNETVPFEEQISILKTQQISQYIENQLWQASSATTCFSGFKELFANTAGVVALTGQTALCSVTGSSAVEKANAVLAQVDNLINAMDRNIYEREDNIVFMSQQQFKCYLTAVRNVNNFYIDSAEFKIGGTVYSVFHPQTNIKVVGVPGLNGSNLIVLGSSQYFLVGTDLASDEDSFRAWWSQDFQEVRMMAAWKLGTAIAFPQFFVTNGLS